MSSRAYFGRLFRMLGRRGPICIPTAPAVALAHAADALNRARGRRNDVNAISMRYRREIVPNANTLEDFQDQYDSMVLEKTLADPCRDDLRWRQVIPSSELADIRRQWPIRPTYRHAGMRYGAIIAP